MPTPAALDITYPGTIDADIVGQQDAEDKARKKQERKLAQAFRGFLAGSDILRVCGGDFVLLKYLLQVLSAEIRQDHIDRAQALRLTDSVRYPLLPATDKLEYLRIELRNEPSIALLAMIERDHFQCISKDGTSLRVFYGKASLADYKSRISWPDIVAPCDIAPETVELATGGPVEEPIRRRGDAAPVTDAAGPHHEAAVQRVRIDRIHDQPAMKADYRAIIAQRGGATPAEIGACLVEKHNLKLLKQGTIDKIETTLTQMVADGVLSKDGAGSFTLRSTADGRTGSQDDEGRGGETAPPGSGPGEGGSTARSMARAGEDGGTSPDTTVIVADPVSDVGEGTGRSSSGGTSEAAHIHPDTGTHDGRSPAPGNRLNGRTGVGGSIGDPSSRE